MPKITFYNLPEDKRETLIQAVKTEFSRVPVYEASITNIIKSANIPRGSFYQYFENKEDAFFFLLNAVVKENKTYFLLMLKKNNGDLFETMIEFYQFIIMEDENIHFLKNTFLNMTHKIETTFARSFSEDEMNEAFMEFCTIIDKSKLNISDNSELIHVLQIITAVTFRNIVAKYSRDISYEEATENYIKEINFLKKGLCLN
ncbi:TetR family transcriptional regulator [Bacillus sp. FJAT-49705]|uniref:TetR family transcriptional regulator n=1 Tax=Cytobacillus citreus TaxID=2833586 RepID=A0ABS5NZ80_9BACI|nr:TetR family transcriptional regulator [Cytobacillus citreus]MBS4193151.1 TetR family transcriptional regulator [Cytobacillus citreus]